MAIVVRNLDAPEEPVLLAPRSTEKPKSDGCCGGEAPSGADACCALDADVKAAGGSGCGCGATAASTPTVAAPTAKSGCC